MVRFSARSSSIEIANLEPNLGIETGGWFVEEKHLRIVDQREGEGETLLLAAGQGRITGFALFPELEPAEERVAIDPLRIE